MEELTRLDSIGRLKNRIFILFLVFILSSSFVYAQIYLNPGNGDNSIKCNDIIYLNFPKNTNSFICNTPDYYGLENEDEYSNTQEILFDSIEPNGGENIKENYGESHSNNEDLFENKNDLNTVENFSTNLSNNNYDFPENSGTKTYILELYEEPLAKKMRALANQAERISKEQNNAEKEMNKLLGNKEIKSRFTKAFNGIALELNQNEVKKLNASGLFKNIYEEEIYKIQLVDSVSLIEADITWKLDKNLNYCNDSGEDCLTGKGIRIGILDTGVDYNHSSLGGCFGPGCRVEGGWDFWNNDPDPMDDQGHGTHVASIAASNGSIVGIAPEATIYAYKVCDSAGSCSGLKTMDAFEKVLDPNNDGNLSDSLDIVSYSIGGGGYSNSAVALAFNNLVDAGVVAVVCAGNSGPTGDSDCRHNPSDGSNSSICDPGTAEKVITVGATDKNRVVASYSSRGPAFYYWGEIVIKPDVVAPGSGISAAALGGGTTVKSGTSMATPMVSGAVALLLQKDPTLTPTQVKNILKNSAIDTGNTVYAQGHGFINISAALRSIQKNCVDNDAGKNYIIRAWSMDDIFPKTYDNCTGLKNLTEYFCSGDSIQSEIYECPEACVNGVCITGCENECALGEKTCFDNTPSFCGNGSDSCYDWVNQTECESGREFCSAGICICINNITMTNWSDWQDEECINYTYRNQSRYQIEYDLNSCGNFTNKTYYEYQEVEDMTCWTCTDECTLGQKQCNGDTTQTCGNNDVDPCNEWIDNEDCNAISQKCIAGNCADYDLCRDTDKGINFFIAGATLIRKEDGGKEIVTKGDDTCKESGDVLFEYFCDTNGFLKVQEKRALSPADGMCVKEKIEVFYNDKLRNVNSAKWITADEVCTDSDAGENYANPGVLLMKKVSGSDAIAEKDLCKEKGDLIYEYYCDDGEYREQIKGAGELGAGMCVQEDVIIDFNGKNKSVKSAKWIPANESCIMRNITGFGGKKLSVALFRLMNGNEDYQQDMCYGEDYMKTASCVNGKMILSDKIYGACESVKDAPLTVNGKLKLIDGGRFV